MEMLRSICLRNVALRSGLKKVSRSTFVRSLANESFRKRHIQRYPLSSARLTHLTLRVPWTESIRHYSSDYPAHSRVLLPALSPTMELGTIVSWEKKEGDKLNEGDLLAEIETDKATMGFETPEEGYLAKILIPAGSKDVPIGKLVCIIVENQADVAAFKDFKDTAAPAPAKAAAVAGAPVAAPVPGSPPPVQSPSPAAEPTGMKPGRLFASPMAKKLAETHNIRLEARLIREGKHAPGAGTGLYNSITSRDVAGMSPTSAKPAASAPPTTSFSSSGPSTNPFIDTPVTGVRATIARRLLESKQTIPHYYLSCDVDVDRITALRQEFNKLKEKEGVRLTVTDFIIKAAAMACRRVPEANSHWLDNVIRQYEQVDMSVAVATDRGLITPIVFGADRRGLVEISRDVKSLAVKAKEGKLAASEYQGGTFTISNLGMFSITNFCAIINPPHSCILAVGGTQTRAVSDPSSEHGIRFVSFITVTLSCDHRVVDGAVGARWMQAFRENIENPYAMLL